jgi:hypothetical protein
VSQPQQPEIRRSGKGATVEDSADPDSVVQATGEPHGTDKGNKGGGEGGGVPPAQQSPYPS